MPFHAREGICWSIFQKARVALTPSILSASLSTVTSSGFLCISDVELHLCVQRGSAPPEQRPGAWYGQSAPLGTRVPSLVQPFPALRPQSPLFNLDLRSNAHTVHLATGRRPRLLSHAPSPLQLVALRPFSLPCPPVCDCRLCAGFPGCTQDQSSIHCPPPPSSCPHRLSGRHWRPLPTGQTVLLSTC